MCPECKGKGEIQLLTSVVPCKCVAGYNKSDVQLTTALYDKAERERWPNGPKLDLYTERMKREGIDRPEAKRRVLAELYGHFNCRNTLHARAELRVDLHCTRAGAILGEEFNQELGALLKKHGFGATMIEVGYHR